MNILRLTDLDVAGLTILSFLPNDVLLFNESSMIKITAFGDNTCIGTSLEC